MVYVAAEKLSENDTHNQKREQGREHAPYHTEVRSFIFFLEIAFYKLREEEAVFKKSCS